jgi:hypothetical protein
MCIKRKTASHKKSLPVHPASRWWHEWNELNIFPCYGVIWSSFVPISPQLSWSVRFRKGRMEIGERLFLPPLPLIFCASSPCSLGSFKCPLCVQAAWACCVQHQQNCTHPSIHYPTAPNSSIIFHPSSSLSFKNPLPFILFRFNMLQVSSLSLHVTYLFIHSSSSFSPSLHHKIIVIFISLRPNIWWCKQQSCIAKICRK